MDVCYNRRELFEKLQPSPPLVRAGGLERPLRESCLQAALFPVVRPPPGRGVHGVGGLDGCQWPEELLLPHRHLPLIWIWG